MKALTLTAPWAWAIAHAGKDIENRKTRCPSILGKRIAIHGGVASKDGVRESQAFEYMLRNRLIYGTPPGLTYGAIVAVVTVVGWYGPDDEYKHDPNAGNPWHRAGDSPWFAGPFGWMLDEVEALPEPVPARGKQGLWDVPPEAEAAIIAQIGGA